MRKPSLKEDKKEFKNISVHVKVQKDLANCGNAGESYNDVLKRVLKEYKMLKSIHKKENSEIES